MKSTPQVVFVVNPVAQPVSWVNPKKRSTHSVTLKKVNLVVNPKKGQPKKCSTLSVNPRIGKPSGQPIKRSTPTVNPKTGQPVRSTQKKIN